MRASTTAAASGTSNPPLLLFLGPLSPPPHTRLPHVAVFYFTAALTTFPKHIGCRALCERVRSPIHIDVFGIHPVYCAPRRKLVPGLLIPSCIRYFVTLSMFVPSVSSSYFFFFSLTISLSKQPPTRPGIEACWPPTPAGAPPI